MKQLSGNQVRQMFLDYFESKGHKVEPSHSLIPNDDPTLLWINAGVAAIKKYFDGSITPENPRITNAQKSIRTNDIENVGKTARHHTFFEMLGNFSIGDYFKEEAIDFAWEFLTDEKWIGFEKDKLYITVHDGDDFAYDYWVNKKGIDPTHMLKTPGNFWEIGEGPCGPDSEIFYDRGDFYDLEGLGTKLFYEELENDRYVEIWNLVFSQYNSKDGVAREEYQELPQKNIDTGMGLERLVSIIQQGETNFDTDFFLPIIHAVEAKANCAYSDNKMAYRVIADHIRTVTFALSDGALFDNAGRGYVLRRILRRAVRFGKQIGIEQAFMYELVQVVCDIMKDYYTNLPEQVDLVTKLVKREEEAFHKTLSNGEKLLGDIIAKNTSGIIEGKDVFKLYDTYGFPFELTLEIAEESNKEVDEKGFREELKIQQVRSRSSRSDVESMASQNIDLMEFMECSSFDYDPKISTGKVIGLFKEGQNVEVLEGEGQVILDATTFYATMGGQCNDTGVMYNEQTKLTVVNVLSAPNKQHLHCVTVESGTVQLGDEFTLEVDVARRSRITANHTATHILQKALQVTLGTHVHQAGSYVDDERLRFDFTHFEKISDEQLTMIEEKVNEEIFKGELVTIESMSQEEAIEKGAMALFGEKYGDVVRVVSVGDYSVELCGGCHVTNSASIGLFKIETEESIGSGTRRIEAVTGKKAYDALIAKKNTVLMIADTLKLKNQNDVVTKVESIVKELHDTKKELEALTSKMNSLVAASKANDVLDINGLKVLLVEEEMEAGKAKQLAFDYRDQLESGVVILVAKQEDKCSYFVAVTKDIVATGKKAGDIVKNINALVDGRGGGKPDLAQGGCVYNDTKNVILQALKNIL
ncbi:alanine--tRNA ligase [Tannockella kyphosi]|uniref:alanine--tRNA ligase n=1 Tax=Tannockella kyphosi TaxID=2899121 RepID=UPI002011D7C7|nr:alanine--tRNA ligase [Tannockella kyphosi]